MNPSYPFVYYDIQNELYGVFPNREVEIYGVDEEQQCELVIIASVAYIDGELRKVDFGIQFFPTLSEAFKYAFTLNETVLFRPKFTRKLAIIYDEVQAIEIILGCTEADHDEYYGYYGKHF